MINEASTINLLNLPLDIKDYIAENHLKNHLLDLVCCSKEYYKVFKPFLWKKIYVPWNCLSSELILPQNFCHNIKHTTCIYFRNIGDSGKSWDDVSTNFSTFIHHFCNVPIEELHIDNVLEDDGVEMICKHLPDLKLLSLKHCSELSVDGWEHLSELKQLVILNIEDCFLRNTGLGALTEIECLEELHVDVFVEENVLITDVGLRYLDDFSSLRKLTLSNSEELELDPDSLHFLQCLSNLTELSLENTLLNDEGLAYIARSVRQLKRLNISHCKQLTDACLSSLCEITSLVEVNLDGLNFSDDALNNFLSNAHMVEKYGKIMVLKK